MAKKVKKEHPCSVELKKYKRLVVQKLNVLNPIFINACQGNFNTNVPIPKQIDNFTELYVGLQMMLELVREKVAVLEENIRTIHTHKNSDSILAVKADRRIVHINQNDILYLQGLKDYVIIHLMNNTRLTIHDTLKNMQQTLDTKQFYRVHNSYVIRLDKISRIENNHVIINNTPIPISRKLIKAFKQLYLAMAKPLK